MTRSVCQGLWMLEPQTGCSPEGLSVNSLLHNVEGRMPSRPLMRPRLALQPHPSTLCCPGGAASALHFLNWKVETTIPILTRGFMARITKVNLGSQPRVCARKTSVLLSFHFVCLKYLKVYLNTGVLSTPLLQEMQL